ncbi:MAG: DUF5666 domain-containing protein [bacterium]|nr:DUF5666 domain-containing protein [bacterium]
MKYVIAPLIAVGLLFTNFAEAHKPEPTPVKHASAAEIGTNGKIKLRGTLTGIAGNTLSVKNVAGTWTVKTTAVTDLIPENLASFITGRLVGVHGTMATGTDWTVNAKSVHQFTDKQEEKEVKKEIKKELKNIRKSAPKPKMFEGKVQAIASSTITLNASTSPITVMTNGGTKFISRVWSAITLGSIQIGDKLQIWGHRASSTVTAKAIRNLSIPR